MPTDAKSQYCTPPSATITRRTIVCYRISAYSKQPNNQTSNDPNIRNRGALSRISLAAKVSPVISPTPPIWVCTLASDKYGISFSRGFKASHNSDICNQYSPKNSVHGLIRTISLSGMRLRRKGRATIGGVQIYNWLQSTSFAEIIIAF